MPQTVGLNINIGNIPMDPQPVEAISARYNSASGKFELDLPANEAGLTLLKASPDKSIELTCDTTVDGEVGYVVSAQAGCIRLGAPLGAAAVFSRGDSRSVTQLQIEIDGRASVTFGSHPYYTTVELRSKPGCLSMQADRHFALSELVEGLSRLL